MDTTNRNYESDTTFHTARDESTLDSGGEREPDIDTHDAVTVRTGSGRAIKPPSRLIEEMGEETDGSEVSAIAMARENANNFAMKLSNSEERYYDTVIEMNKHGDMNDEEFAFVGAGLGGGRAGGRTIIIGGEPKI